MLGFLASLLSPIWGWIIAAVGGLIVVGAAYLRGRSSANKDAVIRTQKEIINAENERRDVDDRLASADDAERERLRAKWRRPE